MGLLESIKQLLEKWAERVDKRLEDVEKGLGEKLDKGLVHFECTGTLDGVPTVGELTGEIHSLLRLDVERPSAPDTPPPSSFEFL